MKVTVVLQFKEFKNDPAQSLLIGASAWKPDLGRRMVVEDIQDMLEEALEHTLALMEQGDGLTVTFETSEK